MRCLFVYYMHKPGGLCSRLYRAMNALAARGNHVVYLTLDQPPIGSVDSAVVIHIIPFPLQRRAGLMFWALFTVWLPIYLCFASLRSRPERVIAFGAYYSTVGYLASRLLGARLILFMRSLVFRNDELTGKPKWLRSCTTFVERFGIRSADTLVCMTGAMREDVLAFAGERHLHTLVLRNDLPTLLPKSENPQYSPLLTPDAAQCKSSGGLLMVTAGVLDKRKNIELLIDAMVDVQRRSAPESSHLMVVGDGSERAALEAKVVSLQLDCVSFLGWVPTAALAIREATLLLHPALHEGMANVVLEAIALDVPVLLSDIPEHRELFDVDSPCLSPTDPKAWAAGIELFLHDPSYRKRIVEASRDLRTELSFDWDGQFTDIVVER